MTNKENYITIVNRNEVTKVYVNDIVYATSSTRRVFFYTDEFIYSMYRKLDDVATNLPEYFYRCHKSCIVNLAKVTKMKNGIIYFENGMSVSICKDRFSKTIQAYKGYLLRNLCECEKKADK